jgi:hypothetical protein
MSEPWGAEVFRIPDLSWQMQAPPTRHAVPVRYVPELEVGDEVTIGLPGHYFIDGQVLARAERQVTTVAGHGEEQESLAVAAPYAYWLARLYPRAGLTMQWWPVAHAWAYRDAVRPGEHPLHERRGTDDEVRSWLDHVRPAVDEPPVRHPGPAREASSLTGRTVRLQHEPGSWSWWVAVSEPLDREGDFVVHVMLPNDYWLAQMDFVAADKARAVPLHRLYVYD